MKKLIKHIALSILLTALFVSCGNPAMPQDQDDGETVEQFLEKLVAFGAGVTEDGTMTVTFVKKGISVYESEYKKENGIWKPLSEEDEINYRIKKISNGIYGISGDGKIQMLLEMKENSLIYRDPENPNTNYYEFIRSESEKDQEFLISEHLLETHLPEPVGENELLGKVFEKIDIGSGSTGEFIDNESFVTTYLTPDGECHKYVDKYSFDSTKKQIYMQRGNSYDYDKDGKLIDSWLLEDTIKMFNESPDLSEEDKLGFYDYVVYNWGRCTVYSYTEENGKMVLKPVFPCETLVDACYEYINFEFENESKDMGVTSYGCWISRDCWILFDRITETTIFGKDAITNESYVIPYTSDFSKPDGEKTITITFEGKNITLTQREIDESSYQEVK